jgi:four helix bundle protein
MATVSSFEELEIWQMARAYSERIFALTTQGSFATDFSLRNQINASCGSIMDNIAEGFERGGNKEFVTFLSYSKGSAGESRSQLYRAFDRKHIEENDFVNLTNESLSISKKIASLMNYLKHSDYRGSKYSEPEVPYNTNPPNLEP